MKNNHLRLGVLLLFIVGIVLANIFLGDQDPKDIKALEDKKNIEDPQLESSMVKKKEKSLSVVSEATENSILDKNVMNESTQLKPTSDTQRSEDTESKRIVAIERRQSRMAERKRYKTARHEWRRSLNRARKEAKISGDYSKYKTIKSNEPGKTNF